MKKIIIAIILLIVVGIVVYIYYKKKNVKTDLNGSVLSVEQGKASTIIDTLLNTSNSPTKQAAKVVSGRG
jgi:uncharacterized protein YxeA